MSWLGRSLRKMHRKLRSSSGSGAMLQKSSGIENLIVDSIDHREIVADPHQFEYFQTVILVSHRCLGHGATKHFANNGYGHMFDTRPSSSNIV